VYYLWLALALVFVFVGLMVLALGDAAVDLVTKQKEVYEAILGEELQRLFSDTSPREFILIHIFVFFGGGILGYLVFGWTGVLIGLGAGAFGPRIYLQRKWQDRVDEVNNQVEEAVVYMANSFKANPSLPEAIKDVVASMGPPISEELNLVIREYQLGTPMDDALINLQNRMPARNLELAISAIRVGRAVGGNIPEILEDIADTIRESHRLERVIDTQTAQGRMQAWVMGAMPIAVCGAFYWLDPGLISPLFQSLGGYAVLAVAAALNLIGVFFIIQVVRIEV
jgi:tight adherence protein B